MSPNAQVLTPANMYAPPASMRELVRTPEHFSRLLWITTTEDRDGVPTPIESRLVLNWIQREYLRKRTPRDLILKPRQEGISTVIQAEAARYCYTRLINVLTLMDTDRNTNAMRRKQDLFYKRFPTGITEGDEIFYKPARDASNAVYTTYSTGAIHTMATAGALSGGRGDSLNYIHLSEAALYKDLYEIRLSVTQAGKPFYIGIESTAHGAQGDFYELCMKAQDGDDSWTLHFFAWFHVPTNRLPLAEGETLTLSGAELEARALWGLDDEQINWWRVKKKDVGYKFEQEYPFTVEGAFLKAIAGMFGLLEGTFEAPMNATPQPHARYRLGIDTGQEDDYTVVSVFRQDSPVQVAALRLRQMPYPVMRKVHIVPFIKAWGVEFGYVETDGIGASMLQELEADLKANSINCQLEGILSKTEKPMLVQSYYDDLQLGLKLLPIPEQMAEHLMYESRPMGKGRWEYGAPEIKGVHDDYVTAGFLGAHARRKIIQRASVTVRKWGAPTGR